MIRFDSLSPEVMQAMCTPMHEILPRAAMPSPPPHPPRASGALYLGSLSAVNDHALLRQHGVTHLVQAIEASWAPPCRPEDGFSAYSIDIRDKETVDIAPYLEAACIWIEKALSRGEGVLVHCQQGVSRSPSIIIAYLIRNHGMSYDAALAHVKRRRACAKPNPGFARALMEWEAMWKARPGMMRRFTA
ncbi:unnamed protein product [Mycena citricolor]|uniref:protein-tyrosine-phosphatase n=1 Tax=Mycena citricolor TaxID=2018698 RepID=A0AAD2HGL9_9AGAR|nr:unnamed protein product [Mycena citricolor]